MVLNETSSSPASPSMSNLSTDDACIGEGSPDSVPPQYTPIDADARAWIDERIAEEVARLKAAGVEAVPLKVKNMSTVIGVPTASPASLPRGVKPVISLVNRVEVRTDFNFNLVRELMLSDAVVCPHRPDYRYVNVLLFAGGDERQPFILPYVFKPHVDVDVGNGTAVARKTTRRHRDEDVSDKRDEHAISEESKGSNESMEKAATTLTSTTTTTLRNKLDDWELVNERGELSRHQIKEFTQH